MEKRVLIAVILSIGIMYGFQYLFPQAPAQKEKQSTVQTSVSSAKTKPASTVQVKTAATTTPSTTQPTPASALPEREVAIETDLLRIVFSSKSGSIKKLVLKKYRETADANSPETALINGNSPLTLTSSADGFVFDQNASFNTTAVNTKITGADKKDIEFVWTSTQGVVLRKVYTVHGSSYAIDLNQQLTNVGTTPLTGTLKLTLANKIVTESKEGRYEVHGPVTFAEGKVSIATIDELAKGLKPFDKLVDWTGFADKYFLNCVLAKDKSIGEVKITQVNKTLAESVISSPKITMNPGQVLNIPYSIYFGPKDLDILKSQGSQLEEAIDFGWFSAIAKPFLYTLNFFYKYTHNYGIAIIIITIILKIFFYPLTHKSYKSMKDMQKIQPKMQALREKYKNDKDAMNKAVMELYRDNKVNPLGGCLPMVVQIPVFFALYKALMFSIELRHAPFFLWITDLSGPDNLFGQLLGLPFAIGPLPLLMGATMFIQQKMTPTQMDPMQAKIMLFLPVVFTFMFLNFPSGLVLYWLINNVLSIAQQWYINNKFKD